VLAHRAGLPAVDQPLSVPEILDGGLERALERQEPYWEPGTDQAPITVTTPSRSGPCSTEFSAAPWA
jgi:hypothetical protein